MKKNTKNTLGQCRKITELISGTNFKFDDFS